MVICYTPALHYCWQFHFAAVAFPDNMLQQLFSLHLTHRLRLFARPHISSHNKLEEDPHRGVDPYLPSCYVSLTYNSRHVCKKVDLARTAATTKAR